MRINSVFQQNKLLWIISSPNEMEKIVLLVTCYLYIIVYISIAKIDADANFRIASLKHKRSAIYPDNHNADEGYLSYLIYPQLADDGMTMLLANQQMDIVSPHFEELLLNLYNRIQSQINSIKDKNVRQNLNIEFNQNIFQFVRDVLIPCRFNAFKTGNVASNDYIHFFHRLIMRKLYIALANASSSLVPICWKSLDIQPKKLDLNSYEPHPASLFWYNFQLSESYVQTDDVDLSAPRIITSEELKIRGHSYYDLRDVEHTEDAILCFDQCMLSRLKLMTNHEERNCFIETYYINMNNFVDQMQAIVIKGKLTYSRLLHLKGRTNTEVPKQFLPNEDNYGIDKGRVMKFSTQTANCHNESKQEDLKMMFVDPALYESVPATFKDVSEGAPKYYSSR
uniref:Uncharacterized protein n=1 Tax=Strigamia maritima TaxID=126957 RepID=T1IS36_STRMM